MSIDKRVKYDVQGGVKNYLGKQKEVKAPLKWQSSPDHPTTELAYITEAEKDLLVKQDLHGSLKGGVNRGPSGIMSLNGWGSYDSDDPSVDTGMSGTATSAAESGGGSGADARELAAERGRVRSDLGLTQLPPGVVDQDTQDYRNAFIAAGGGQRVNPGFFDSKNTVSPAELAAAKAYNPTAFRKTRGGGIMDFITGGGILGNIVRGIGQKFGLGKRYNEPTYDMSRFNNTRVYEGTMDPTVNPEYYNDLGNELMLSTKATPPTLDLSKLETGDLNNLASLIKASQKPKALQNEKFDPNDISTWYDTHPATGEAVMTPSFKEFFQDTGDPLNPRTVYDSYEFKDTGNPFKAKSWQRPYSYDGSVKEGVMGIDVGQDDIAFQDDLMAKVTQDDIDRSKSRAFKAMDYDTYKMIVPNTQVTPYEFEQLKKGNITEPGTYTV